MDTFKKRILKFCIARVILAKYRLPNSAFFHTKVEKYPIMPVMKLTIDLIKNLCFYFSCYSFFCAGNWGSCGKATLI